MLDTMDLVHLPLFTSGFYYLLVVNFKRKVFEVIMANRKFHLVENEAVVVINNFKMAFSLAYKNSPINIRQMQTVFQSVCNTERDGDSGIFMMKLICDYNRDKKFLFRPEHAKPIREILTYYMVAHPFNEKMPPQTKRILQKHNVPYDYSTPGYFPWMHEQSESVSEDPIESMFIF